MPLELIDGTYGVEGNTFRAYRGYKIAPSEVFRGWAKLETEKIKLSPPTINVSTQKGFYLWHSNMANSLNTYWSDKQSKILSYAHTYKLIDLYVKWLSQFKFSEENFVINLNKYASCALDKQTLKKINICYGLCMPINQPSMGNIYNEKTYEFCQTIINDFCRLADSTKLEFDYWVWKKGG